MRLTFALVGDPNARRVLGQEQPPNVLCTQLALKGLLDLPYVPEFTMLDSGAFSAWNAGTPVTMESYLPIATQVQERWPSAQIVNLDVIPGAAGRTATPFEIQAGMLRSLANADRLRSAGLRVIEVFHQNEPFAFLDELLARRTDEHSIVGISPRNDLNIKARLQWLGEVMGHLLRSVGRAALPKTHGFAATSKEMLQAFPFYSADSISWAAPYVYGRCINEHGIGQHVENFLPSTRCKAGTAKRLTLILNETRGRSLPVDVAALLAEIAAETGTEEARVGLPFSEKETEDLLKMVEYDWEQAHQQGQEQSGGHGDEHQTVEPFVTITVMLPESAHVVWLEAVEKVKRTLSQDVLKLNSNEAIANGQVVEALSAEYLASP